MMMTITAAKIVRTNPIISRIKISTESVMEIGSAE